MLKSIILITLLLTANIAQAEEPLWPIDKSIAIELTKRGNESQFMFFDLIEGGNDILHGYTPKDGDTIEWYVRNVDCSDPPKKCTFELAIRKK